MATALTPAKTPGALTGDFSTKANAIFRAVFRELANRRAGTASTKKRDEVRGGGRKPWRQKGTGRARHGSIRSPQWRHGGVVFGPQPRSYETDLNKKERRIALVAALADRFQNEAVLILDAGALDGEKTKALATLLFGSPKAAKNGPRTLVVFAQHELELGTRLHRAGRNLQAVGITHTGALDVKDVLGHARLIFTQAAYDKLNSALTEATS
jgi:large subunit ribosomal protein L4